MWWGWAYKQSGWLFCERQGYTDRAEAGSDEANLVIAVDGEIAGVGLRGDQGDGTIRRWEAEIRMFGGNGKARSLYIGAEMGRQRLWVG